MREQLGDEIRVVALLTLLALLLFACGVVWDQHLTIALQDRSIEMLQSIKCSGEQQT